jgi:hypothetical protein
MAIELAGFVWTKAESGSDAEEFRKALLSLPYHLDFGF